MSHMYEKVVSVICKEPDERKDSDLDLLLPWFRKKSDVFHGTSSDVMKDIIRNCQFFKAAVDDIIIRQGDIGHAFYMILGGNVSVYIKNSQESDDEEEREPGEDEQTSDGEQKSATNDDNKDGQSTSQNKRIPISAIRRRGLSSSSEESRNVQDDDSDDDDDIGSSDEEGDEEDSGKSKEKRNFIEPLDRTEFGTHIRVLGPGSSFGELALIRENCIRNASIIANTVTDMIAVDRDLYSRSLRAAQEQELNEKYDFIDTCPLFGKWNSKHKTSVAMGLRAFNVQFGNPIVRQGDHVRGLFFIVHGQSKVSMEPQHHVHQYPDLSLEKSEDTLTGILAELLPGRKLKDRKEGSFEARHSGPNISRRREGYAAAERQRTCRTIDVCVVGANEIIGDIEMALGLDSSIQTVTCLQQNVLVYEMDTKNFERLVVKRNPNTLSALRSIVEDKLRSRVNSTKTKKIPLLNNLLVKIIEKNINAQNAKDKKKKNHDNTNHHLRDYIPPRGPLIDEHGPGSLSYRNRIKEKQRKRLFERTRRKTDRENTDMKTISNLSRIPHATPVTSSDAMLPSVATTHHNTFTWKTRPYTAPEFSDMHVSLTMNLVGRDDDNDSFYEATDHELSQLEDRIKSWHSHDDGTKPSFVPVTRKLHRIKLEKDSWVRKKLSPTTRTPIHSKKMDIKDTKVLLFKDEDDIHDKYSNPESEQRSIRWKSASSSAASHVTDAELTDGGDTGYESCRDVNSASVGHNRGIRTPSTPRRRAASAPPSPLTSKKYLTIKREKSTRQYSAEEYKALKERLRKAQKRQHYMMSSLW